MAKKQFKISLKTKLTALLLSMSVISIGITAYITFLSSEHYFTQSMEHSLDGLAKVKSQAIDNLITDRVDYVQRVAAYPYIVMDLGKFTDEKQSAEVPSLKTETSEPADEQKNTKIDLPLSENSKEEEKKDSNSPSEGIFEEVKQPESEVETKKKLEESSEYQALNKILSLIAGDGQKYEELFILDISGVVIVSTVYENEGKSAANTEFFTNGAKTTFIQNVFVSEITKKLSMVIATPIKDENGKVIGVLGARLNLDVFYKLIGDEAGLGKTGETLVGKRIEKDVVFMSPTRYDDQAALKRKVAIDSELEYPLQEASRGGQGSGLYNDYRGTKVLSAWQHIPSLDWGIVVKMDANEALEPIISVRNWIIILTGGLILIIAILSNFMSKQIVEPIRELTQAANAISKGDIDVKITIKSKDEVGELADSFERMLASIRFLREDKKEEK